MKTRGSAVNCEMCGTKIRKNATCCYVKGCIAYKLDIAVMESDRDSLVNQLIERLGGI